MTDLLVTNFADSWTHSTRPTANYGGTNTVVVSGGTPTRYGWIRPRLSNILGRTVTSATLRGRVSGATAAATWTARPITEAWAEGWITADRLPATTATNQTTTTTGALPDGGIVEWTGAGIAAAVQLLANGGDFYGWRISSSLTTAEAFVARDSGDPAWELSITLADEPEQPSELRPDGGGAVSSATPTLSWTFVDFGGESTVQGSSRVQVDTPTAGNPPDEVAPDYDSGWQTNAEPEWPLSGLHTLVGAGPHYWRVQARDGVGEESDWSDWAEFGVSALPSLVIDTPTGDVGDPRVAAAAHLSSGTVGVWRIRAYGPERSDQRASSGLRSGGPVSWEAPFKNSKGRRVFKEDEGGWLRFEVWDDIDRAEAVGDPGFLETWVPITWADDGAQVAPTNLIVTQTDAGDPRLTWQWSSTDTADAWALICDGVTVVVVDGDDIAPNAGNYTWTDSGEVEPLRPHTLQVKAIRNKKRSAHAQVSNWSHTVKGVWLLPDDAAPIVLDGTAVGDFAHSDRMATYEPMVGPPVDIVYDHVGMAGSFVGSVDSRRDVWATLDALEALRNSMTRTAQMVWGSRSIRVRLRDVSAAPDGEILPSTLLHSVRFGFVQVDD